MVRAVTFDFWNTLMWEESGSLKARRLEVWTNTLAAAGISVDSPGLERGHDAAHNRYVSAWKGGQQFKVDDAAAVILAELDSPLPEDMAPMLVEGFSQAGWRAAVHPSPGVEECLSALKASGVRLGIICDIGLTPSPVVRGLLDRHGLLALFDDTTFSDEVGHYKPAPAIFEHALGALGGVPPGAAAHVGDRRRTDVGGALAAGMTAVRYNGVYEDEAVGAPEGHMVVGDLAQLPAVLDVREPP